MRIACHVIRLKIVIKHKINRTLDIAQLNSIRTTVKVERKKKR